MLKAVILLGVKEKTGEVVGLTYQQIKDFGNQITSIATDNIIIAITAESIATNKQVMEIL